MATTIPDARLKLIAENLARAALQELQRDVKGAGQEVEKAAGGFGRMVFANGQLIASTQNARRGFSLLENGLQQLGVQALGVQGPIGQLGRGIGMLGLSTGPLAIATLAVGAFGLAWKAASDQAELAADNVVSASERMSRNLARLDQEDTAALKRRIADERENLNILRSSPLGPQRFREIAHAEGVTSVKEGSPAEDRKAALATTETLLRRLGVRLAQLEQEDAKSKRTERIREQNRFLAEQLTLVEGISQSIADFFSGPAGFPTFAQETIAGIKVPTLEEFQAQEGRRVAGLQVAELEKQGGEFAFGLDQAFFDRVQADVDAAIGAFDEGGKSAGMIMAQSFVLALPGLMSGKAAGIFAGFGQLATGASALKGAPAFLGPLGFGLGALGTVVALFGGGQREAERRHRAELEELRRIRQNTDRRDQPSRSDVHIYLDDAEITDRVMYQIRRAERSDATPMLSPR